LYTSIVAALLFGPLTLGVQDELRALQRPEWRGALVLALGFLSIAWTLSRRENHYD
jgi:hypothetical protein